MSVKKKLYRWAALALAALVLAVTAPAAVWAVPDGAADTNAAGDAAPAVQPPTEGEPAEGPAASPEQGALPDKNGAGTPQTQSETIPATYTVTLHLDGGQANGLVGAGWTAIQGESYSYSRTVTEAVAGQGYALQLDGTLGGLLPGAPYRAGYTFLGWQVDGAEAEETVILRKDTVVTARWKEAVYHVTFQWDSDTWEVNVPYGATLWTEEEAPWTEPGVEWSEEGTAFVPVAIGDAVPQTVTVTRHDAGEGRYYTFTLDSVPYFTYGGKIPALDTYHFTGWRKVTGGSGYTVLSDVTFTAQFAAITTYVVSVYYYYDNGSRVEDCPPQSVTWYETDIQDGNLTFDLEIPALAYRTGSLTDLPEGVEAGKQKPDGTVPITLEVEKAFPGTASATRFLALTVVYEAAEMQYEVVYYQQELDGTYRQVGSRDGGRVRYAQMVTVPDRPELAGASFDGFAVSGQSRTAVFEGIRLQEGSPGVEIQNDNKAVISVYYDRASYFIYIQTGTSEVQIDPLRVRFGDAIPSLDAVIDQLHRTGYQTVTREDITWNYLTADGTLQEVPENERDGRMPAYDLYVVIHWRPNTTSLRIVYWVEGKNSPEFQNAYTWQVEGIPTEEKLTVTLDGSAPTIQGTGVDFSASDGFEKLMVSRYGDADFATFFSYDLDQTRRSPGNVASALSTSTGGVTGGVITGGSFQVEAAGDGSTTINVYYTRNLYTLAFVLGRENTYWWGGTYYEVATNTPGTFFGAVWTNAGGNSLRFMDFGPEVAAEDGSGEYGGLMVSRIYRLADAQGVDDRAPVGRYGTQQVDGYLCDVYYLTARFEADIAALWPTAANIALASPAEPQYISMGSDQNSYYRRVVGLSTGNSNILNAYSSMDRDVVASGWSGSWSAAADGGNGAVTHQMVAYWTNSPYQYTYHFLYEPLDTTLTADSPGVVPFDAEQADAGHYDDGQLVSWKGNVYVYRNKGEFVSIQRSSNTKEGQNQPAKQGYSSQGKAYAGEDEKVDAKIYFFYTRQTYTLSIQNVTGPYEIPEALGTQAFSCLQNKTLRQLGWQWQGNEVLVRYGGTLAPLQEEEILDWLTSPTGGGLAHPITTAGENQYYFHRWYRNAQQTVAIDWSDHEMRSVQANITLYTGYFTPRYTTSYVLNGGVWQDAIGYTLIAATAAGEDVFLYYPHRTQDGQATVYWYAQSKTDDRLYVNTLYQTTVGEVLEWDPGLGHWKLRGDVLTSGLPRDTVDTAGTRLVDHYYCYMGQTGLDASNNHEVYVNINTTVNTVLSRPRDPLRNGYAFAGWYYFDDTETGEKVYIDGLLSAQQGAGSYDEDHVYLDHVGDAHLLHRDAGGLFYYESQTGYRFSYENDASIVSSSRVLYAAWESTADVSAWIYHLVPVGSVQEGVTSLQPRGESKPIPIPQDSAQGAAIRIGGTRYYILRTETRENLYTGSTLELAAWEFCTDNTSRKWLPRESTIAMVLDEGTQTVDQSALDTVTGNTYRVQNQEGGYDYYAFFVYEATQEVQYRVYAIDLAAAVSMGALGNYQDTFSRDAPPDANAPYVLYSAERSWNGGETTLVTENAPAISGYVVYLYSSQTLQLQAIEGGNNIYFYYVRDGSQITYTVHYYLARDGVYSQKNRVTFTGIPAIHGEILRLDRMGEMYGLLLSQADTYSGYADSQDDELKALYQRYQGMQVAYTQEGTVTAFTVDITQADTLKPAAIAALPEDYFLEGWSPTGETLVLSNEVVVDVYLGTAELVVRKVDGQGRPLSQAVFTLERLVEDPAGDILHDGVRYRVDEAFAARTGQSQADGRVAFGDLSAWTGEDGAGYLYRLTETQAPPGYNRLENPMYCTAPYTVEGTTHYTVTYTVTNSGISYLPEAGGSGGVLGVMFLGGGLTSASMLLAAALGRRRGRHRHTAKRGGANRPTWI